VTGKFIKELNLLIIKRWFSFFLYLQKRDKYNKRYIGQTVLIFDKDGNQQTLYYNISKYHDNYDILSIKELLIINYSPYK
jgi:hypothetical protein